MSFNLFNDSITQGVEYALNNLALREQVVAQNIANVQTPGYVAQDVTFQGTLSSILSGESGLPSPQAVGQVVAAPDYSARQDGNSVSLESEMGRQNQTSALYDTLTQLMADRLSVMKTAVSG